MSSFFNIFITLLMSWLMFLSFDFANLSRDWLIIFLAFGLLLCVSIAIFFAKSESDNGLYFSYNFYRHFIDIYISSFLGSMLVIFALATKPHKLIAQEKNIDITNIVDNDLILSISLNCLPAVLCLQCNKRQVKINCLDFKYFSWQNVMAVFRSLKNIDDSQLI